MQQISLSLLSLHRSKQGNVSHFISAVQTPECSTTDAHTDTHTLTVTAFFRSTAQFKNLRLVLFFFNYNKDVWFVLPQGFHLSPGHVGPDGLC